VTIASTAERSSSGHRVGDCLVAEAVAGSRRIGTIALEECDRRAAGAVVRTRTAEFGRERKPPEFPHRRRLPLRLGKRALRRRSLEGRCVSSEGAESSATLASRTSATLELHPQRGVAVGPRQGGGLISGPRQNALSSQQRHGRVDAPLAVSHGVRGASARRYSWRMRRSRGPITSAAQTPGST
jgi:hypothetical protein